MSDATQPGRNCHRSISPPALRPAAVTGLVSVALALLALGPVIAQAPDRPAIAIAASIIVEPATEVSFPIWVGPASSIPRNSFVRVRGLPPMAALSEGHSIGSGSWAIPLAALPELKISLPVSAVGKTNVHVTLVGVDGAALVEAKVVLVIAAHMTIPATSPPVMQPEDRQRALMLVKKGDEELAEGRVATARLSYERAADMGLAQAALALAATYDAAELIHPHLRGVEPDAKEAKRWYERAHVLGAREAEQRLQRLGANR